MSKEKGECIHNFRVGRTWFSIFRNTNQESGRSYHITTINHAYRDGDGNWKPSKNFTDGELADLETGISEARRRLRVVDATPEIEKETHEGELFVDRVKREIKDGMKDGARER